MINKVILIGNLGETPETRTLESGQELTRISIATSERYKDKAGEWQENTEWHKVVCWGRQAEQAARFGKGDTIYLEGRLTTRSWEDDKGQKRYTTEVIARHLRRIVNRQSDERPAAQQAAVDAFKAMPDETTPEGDLPF